MEGWRKNKRGQEEQRLRLRPRQALRVRMKRMDSWQQGRLRAARPSNHQLLEEGGRKERQRRKTRRTHAIHIDINIHIHIPTVAVATPSYPVDVPGRCAILPPIPGPPNKSSTGSRFVLERLLTPACAFGLEKLFAAVLALASDAEETDVGACSVASSHVIASFCAVLSACAVWACWRSLRLAR
jgi:hypothetical protein